MFRCLVIPLLASLCFSSTAALASSDEVARNSLQDYARHSQFNNIKISPGGDYLAASTRSSEGRVRLVVLDMETMDVLSSIEGRAPQSVGSFDWANDDSILVSIVMEIGSFEAPGLTGEIFLMSADGRRRMALTGPQSESQDYVMAEVFHMLPDDDNSVMIYEYSLRQREPFMRLSRVLLNSGRKIPAGRVPLRSSREGGIRVIADAQGVARAAGGIDPDDVTRNVVLVRDDAQSEWRRVIEQPNSSDGFRPLAFSEDGSALIGVSQNQTSTAAITSLDLTTLEEEVLATHPLVDLNPVFGVSISGESRVIGASYEYHDLEGIVFEDALQTDEGMLAYGLMDVFENQMVEITSATKDGNTFILRTGSANEPQMFYRYDRETNNLGPLIAARPWLDKDLMPVTESIQYKSRDGLDIHALLTLPHFTDARDLPLVLLPHGGPHGVRDSMAQLDVDAKVLASHGYAVLQPNFRGSGGFGGGFEAIGYRRWGTAMIDDMTDGVQHLIGKDIVDAGRVCAYGGSYGGYAALQSAIREPDLYQCTIGFVGVYDLDMMFTEGDIPTRVNGRNYLNRVLPPAGEQRQAQSPIHNLDKLKAPVLLIHGGQDQRVPQVQAEQLRDALEARNHPVEWMDKRTEGHGFYNPDNNVERWELMLDFLGRHIGQAP